MILVYFLFINKVFIHRNYLHLACLNGRYDIANYLIKKGFDINSRDNKKISFCYVK